MTAPCSIPEYKIFMTSTVRCWLEPRPMRPPEPRDFVRSVCLGAHLELLPPARRDQLVDAVTEALGSDPVLDYVRLNISGRRAAVPTI